jgi:hypothetical protein
VILSEGGWHRNQVSITLHSHALAMHYSSVTLVVSGSDEGFAGRPQCVMYDRVVVLVVDRLEAWYSQLVYGIERVRVWTCCCG